MFKLEFYVPEDYADRVKEVLFAAGAGKIGNYDCCCWEMKGDGQFRPCEGSNPFCGTQHKIENVSEIKVEMVCSEDVIKTVIQELKKAHPYETPAYYYFKVLS